MEHERIKDNWKEKKRMFELVACLKCKVVRIHDTEKEELVPVAELPSNSALQIEFCSICQRITEYTIIVLT